MNDTAEERSPVIFDPLQFLGCVALNCLLSLFILGAPFAVLFSHRVLPHPFSKIASILGIAISHIVFGVPVGLLIVLMLIGLVTVDAVERGAVVHHILIKAILGGLGGASAVLLVSARGNGSSVESYWISLSNWLAQQLLTHFERAPLSVEALAQVIQIQFPISMVALIILSVWLGIGLASHLSWFGEEHPLSAKKLRDTSWGIWIFAGFFSAILGRVLVGNGRAGLIAAGLEAIFGALLFCQGSVAVSNMFERRGLSRTARSFWYVILSTVGFYFSIALGVLWMVAPTKARFRRRVEHESHIA